MREVIIIPALNGFIVRVGCQTLVFGSIEAVADELVQYQKDPRGTEERFLQRPISKSDCDVPPPAEVYAVRPEVNQTMPGALAGRY